MMQTKNNNRNLFSYFANVDDYEKLVGLHADAGSGDVKKRSTAYIKTVNQPSPENKLIKVLFQEIKL